MRNLAEMAREAGFETSENPRCKGRLYAPGLDCEITPELERFAAAVRAQALEEAAKKLERLRDGHCADTQLCHEPEYHCHADDDACDFVVAWNVGAAAIRALVQQEVKG